MATSNQENAGTSIFGYHQFQWLGLPAKSVMELAREAKKLGRDDPRRITHSLKAGLSLVLVSLFYHVDPLYSSFGDNTTWAVMTAVVIFEFSVGFGGEYCGVYQEGLPSNDRSFLQGYKSVLNSQSSEENMANLARWEPAHGRFRFFHPWKQYLKIGSLTRLCAIKIDVLNNYLNPQIQTPLEIRSEIKEQCMTISLECGKALKESSASIRRMIRADTAHLHIGNSKAAAENLKILFKTGLWKEADLLEIAPATTVACLLLEVVLCTERIVDAVQELASLAGFKSIESSGSIEQLQRSSQQIHSIDAQNHEITIGE
ncbi:hypothetical protein GH714_009878 [Hevea brasiliensis]|uniref:Aluminum-activated malate transporter n=1 Tax=Hevea brasiliensis TaxID=3981 RepID=A0A6A6NA44_HEVBR|nr:hypothetical protein GH714_009878 [Hevea brasiliensis]